MENIIISKFIKSNLKNKIIIVALWYIYFTWFFLIINKGIDLTDSAYVFTTYKYAFNPQTHKDVGYAMSEILGGIIWKLFPIANVLFINIFSAILCSVSGIFIYLAIKPYLSQAVLLFIMIIGSLFSLGWIHFLHYNSWTVFFLSLEICLLFRWFQTRNARLLFACGLVYGFNIYIRLPNVLHGVCIIAILWYIHHSKQTNLWHSFILMIVGAVLSLGFATVITIIWVGGYEKFFQEIGTYAFWAVDKTETTGHNIWYSIIVISQYYRQGAQQALKDIMLCILIAMSLKGFAGILQKYIFDSFFEKFLHLNIIVGIIAAILVFSNGYLIELNLSVCIYLAITLCFIGTWYFRKKDIILSSMSLTTLIVELIFKIGTNNDVKFNVIFMTLPIGMVTILLCQICKNQFKEFKYAFVSFLIALTLLVSIHQAGTYIYRDANYTLLTDKVKAPEYLGMRTNPKRAEMINTMETILNQLPEGELLMIGMCNIGYVISNHVPITRAWTDVSSYSYEEFDSDLTERFKEGMRPYIIIAKPDEYSVRLLDKEKISRIFELTTNYEYRLDYSCDTFDLYLPK